MERTGGSYIYSQLRGEAESSAWNPEYIEGTFGVETSATLNNYLSQAKSGTMVNYTARDDRQLKLAFFNQTVYSSESKLGADVFNIARSHNVEILADDIKNAPTVRDIPDSPSIGKYNHGKVAQITTTSNEIISRIMTANLTKSALSGTQNNTFFESKNNRFNSEVASYQQYIKTGQLPEDSNNFKYLSITSPATPFRTVSRLAHAFGSEDSKQPLYLTSATLTSPLTMAIAKAQLSKGGTVNVVTETFNKQSESVKEFQGTQLANLQVFASNTTGQLNFGTYSSSSNFFDTHANDMVQGDTFSIGSERASNTAQAGSQAEATLIAKNKIVSQEMRAYFEQNFQWSRANSMQDLRGLKHKGQFVEFVNTQKLQRNIDIVIPAQMNKNIRQMYHEGPGYNFTPSHQGVLTNAYIEYGTRDPKYKTDVEAYNAAIRTGKYMELLSIQADWVNKFTWGETWGQLGNRGAISTAILMATKMGDEKLNSWFMNEEESAKRFYIFYKPMPVKTSEILTDTFRHGLDYFQNLEMNLLMFNTATTTYSLLLLGGSKFLKTTGEVILGRMPGSTDIKDIVTGTGLNKLNPFWLARGMASEAAMMLFGPVAGALDVLTGAGGAGGWQFTNERSIKHTTNTARGHRDVNRLMMVEGYNFTRNNPFMKITGVSLLSEFFHNAHAFVANTVSQIRQKKFSWRNSAAILKYQLFYEGNNAAHLARAAKNPAIGARLSKIKIASATIFAAIGFDQFTAYLGENLGGIDAIRVERANQILRDAAAATGNIHPVQLARTSNVGVDWTGNGWKDTYLAAINAPKAVYRSVTNLARNIFSMNMRNFLGVNAIEKGREMEAAQQALARGDDATAIKYALLAENGSKSLKDDMFRGDMWKTWIFQLSQNPLQFTYTLAINQRRIYDQRAGNIEIQEFGYTLQGPVAIRIGVSSDVPYQFYKKLDYSNQKDLPFEPWVFQFKPGSNWVNSFTVAALIHTGDITFRGITWAAAKGLNAAVNPRYPVFTEFARQAHEWAFAADSRYMNQTYKAGAGGAKLTITGRMSVTKAAMTILMLPATLPIMTKAVAFNVVANLVETGIFGIESMKKTGDLEKWMTRRDASGNKLSSLTALGQAWKTYKGAWYINSIERDILREAMDINTLEDFHKAFGDTSTEFSAVDKVKLQAEFDDFKADTNKFMRRVAIRNPFNAIHNIKNPFIHTSTKVILGAGSASLIALGVSYSAIAIEAGKSVAEGKNLSATIGFIVGNKLLNWAASNTEKMQTAVDNSLSPHANSEEKVTWLYKLAASIDKGSSYLFPFLQSIGKMVAGSIRLIDTSGSGIPNIVSAAAGVIGEMFIGASAGVENVKWNSVTRQYEIKDSSSLYKPGFLSAIAQAFAGGLKAFQNGFYLPFGSDQYIMMGPFGATKTEVDKDTTEWASTFSQASILMFLTSGYSEKFLLRGSVESRAYQQYKKAAQHKYEPMGMRMLTRDRAIRGGKMYHDDIVQDATTWGMRVELARRAEMFRWIKHVDARDILEIPGFVSKEGKSYDIARFKDAANEKEAALYSIMQSLTPHIFKGMKPGHLEQIEEEIDLDSALLAEQRQQEALGPNGITTTLANARLMPEGSLKGLILAGTVAVGALGAFKVLQNVVDWSKVTRALGSLVSFMGFTSLAEKLNLINTKEESRKLNIFRNALPKARLRDLGRGLMFLEIDGVAYYRGNDNIFSKVIQDILKLYDVDEKDLRKIFFVQEELKTGTLAPFMRILNKHEGFSRNIEKLEKSKKLKVSSIFEKLDHVRNQLDAFKKDAELLQKLLNNAGHGEHLDEMQKFIEGMEAGKNRIDRLLEFYTDAALSDENVLGKVQSLDDEITFKDGKKTTLRSELNRLQADSHMAKGENSIAKYLVGLMKRTGQISEIGLIRKGGIITNVFKNFLVKFGIDKSVLDRVSETLLKTNEEILDLHLLGPTAAESKIQPGFIKFAEFDKVFQAKFLQQLVTELKALGYNTDDLMQEIIKYLKNSSKPGASTIEKMLIDTLVGSHGTGAGVTGGSGPKITLDQIKNLIAQLQVAGKLDPNAATELIEGRLNAIWNVTKAKAVGEVAGKALVEGTEIHLFGKFKINASALGMLTSTAGHALQGFFNLANISGALAASWYATEAHNINYSGSQRREFAKIAEEQYDLSSAYTLSGLLSLAGRKFFSSALYTTLINGISTRGFGLLLSRGLGLLGTLFVGGTGILALLPTVTLVGLSFGLEYLFREKSEDAAVQKGLKLKDNLFVKFGIDAKNNAAAGIHSWFVRESSITTRNYYLGKQTIGNSIFNFLFHGDWDASKYQLPSSGILWNLLDPLMRGIGAFDPSNSVPPSLNPHSHKPFLERTALFIGTDTTENTVNQFIVNLGISEQQSRLMSKPESWAYSVYHPTLFGAQSKSEVIAADKDGRDPLAPGWIRNDFRHQMFREQSTVLTQGLETVLKMRGDLEIQILSNLADEKRLMGKVMLVSPDNIQDPRSGGALPGDTYLTVVPGSEILGMSYSQPREDLRHPVFQGQMSGLRNKWVGGYSVPIPAGPVPSAKSSPRGGGGGAPGTSRPSGRPTPPSLPPVGKPTGSVPISAVPEKPALAAKQDPYLTAMANVAIKVQQAKDAAEVRVAERAKNPVYIVVPNAGVQPTDPHVIACDTSISQHRRDTKFSTRNVKANKSSGVVLDAYRVHDNHDIESACASDTFNTGTNQNWFDTWS